MLILAGVSLNAIVGDNGIITNAQTASVKSGMAVLEEFLQQKYVENVDKDTKGNNKVAMLMSLESCRDYFYGPKKDDGIGGVDYIVDAEGHAIYLINKSNLPVEIRDNLKGGDCGAGKTGSERYKEYVELIDVYGVTEDLKVYYASSPTELLGLNRDDSNIITDFFQK